MSWSSLPSLMQQAYEIYTKTPHSARQVGHWVVHPTTFDQLRMALWPGSDPATMGTFFGRPIHSSAYLPIGVVHFVVAPKIPAVELPPGWSLAETATAMQVTFDSLTPAIVSLTQGLNQTAKAMSTIPPASIYEHGMGAPEWPPPKPPKWSGPEPEWLGAMFEEMAIRE